VFWPYAYDYMFGYIFSPWLYYDPFWGYGPFALFASLFWPYAWAPYYADDGFGSYDYGVGLPFTYGDVYGYPDYARTRVARTGATSRNRAPADVAAAAPTAVSGMCSGQAGSLTGLPIDQIDRTIQPTDDQRVGLDALKAASAKVTDILGTSCPTEIPMTAPGRLAAMENRLEAMRRAVETVRAPLETFYGSLTDEQKAQFDTMKVETELQATQGGSRSRRTVVSSAQVCRAQTLDYSAAFPEQEIEKSIQPTEAQKAALDELRAAATKGPDLLKDTCPAEKPSTPTVRLAAVQARLEAMLEVVKTERPAMDKFYSLLSDEQKAQFDAMKIEPELQATQGGSRSRRTVVSSAQVCRAQTLDYSAAFPDQEIEKSIQPTEAQKAALDELRAAAIKGPDLLKDTCPTEMPSTPTLRLAAVQARLAAMLEVVKTERPAMEKFYSLLSDEQKARFNALRPPQQPNRHQG